MLWEFKTGNTTLLGYDENQMKTGPIVGEFAEDFDRWSVRLGSTFREMTLSPLINLPSDDPSDNLKLARKYISKKRLGLDIEFTKSDTFTEARSVSRGEVLY